MEYWVSGDGFQVADRGLCPVSVALISDLWQFVLSSPINPLLQYAIGFYEITTPFQGETSVRPSGPRYLLLYGS